MKRLKLFGCVLLILSVLIGSHNVAAAVFTDHFTEDIDEVEQAESAPVLRAIQPGKITISSVSLAQTGVMNVKWKPDTYADGYRLQYSTTSTFSKPTSRYISGRNITSATISGLNPNNRYYVRICGYAMTPDIRRVFGAWSSTKSVIVPGTHGKQTINVKTSVTADYKANGKFSLNALAAGKLTYKSNNTKVAVVSTGGTITMKGCGEAVITITAAATPQYDSATAKVTLKIKPAQITGVTVSSNTPRTITIKWKRDTSVDGYDIQFSSSKSFTASTTKTGYADSNRIVQATPGGLSKGTRYYVRVRGYKTVNKTKWTGKWSAVKYVVAK